MISWGVIFIFVTATIYSRYNETIKTDIEKYNKQYSPIEYIQFSKAVHDRFLIIDDVVYHMGASVKDMGKSLCAVTLASLFVKSDKIRSSIYPSTRTIRFCAFLIKLQV